MKKILVYIEGAALLVSAAIPRFFATAAGAIEPPASVGIASTGVIGIACLAAQWLFTAAIILSIILAIWTGIKYMRAAGDPENFKIAHKRLLYLAIGIAVAIIARTLPVLIGTILGTGNPGGLGSVCN